MIKDLFKFVTFMVLGYNLIPIYAMEGTNYSIINDDTFYSIHRKKSLPQSQPSDEQLKIQPKISAYAFDCEANNDKPLLVEFAKRRIQSKKTDNSISLTQKDVDYLQSDPSFLLAFTEFLKKWSAMEFYSSLSAKAFEVSREIPTEEYPKGKPGINPAIRAENSDYVRRLDQNHDQMYNSLHVYMKHIADTHAYGYTYEVWNQVQKDLPL